MMGCLLLFRGHPGLGFGVSKERSINPRVVIRNRHGIGFRRLVRCSYDGDGGSDISRRDQQPLRQQEQPQLPATQLTGIRLYREIERYSCDRQLGFQGTYRDGQAISKNGCERFGDLVQVEGAWVLQPRDSPPKSVVHFVGGIFVGAAPQITYCMFLVRLAAKFIIFLFLALVTLWDLSSIFELDQGTRCKETVMY